MAREYIAFISYRHAPRDSAVAQTAHSLIEQYRIPRSLRKGGKKRFGYVFRDQEELPVSSDLSDDICKALDHSQNLIVICSPETQKSPWVAREIAYFLEHHDHSHVFAVLAQGEPAEVFPQRLTQVILPDGTVTEVEPLAMDARADSVGAMKRKLRGQIRRLYAALLGCPYDRLVLRQQRRVWRRITAVAAVVLAAVLGFSGMLLAKNGQIKRQNQDLAAQKQELAAQKQELQLRESELLTRDALEYLLEGDRASAAESAVAALPETAGERPYYPQAEAALIQSLGIFEEPFSGYWVTETALSLSAPVQSTVLNQEGTRLAAADQHNEVTCFDTTTGEKRWSVLLDTSGITHMQAQKDQVLCLHTGGMTALSWEDGSILWNYRNNFVSDLPCVLSEDGTKLMLLQWRMTMDFERYEFFLVELDARTGQQLQTIFVTQGMSVTATEEIPYVEFTGVLGAFAPEGNAFAGVFSHRNAAGEQYLAYYMADLTNGTVRRVYTREAGQDGALAQIWFDGSECIAAYRQDWSKTALGVEKVDVAGGTQRWYMLTPEENDWIEYDAPVSFLRGGNSLYATCGRYVYGIDLEDGTVLCRQSMDAPILSVRVVDQYYLEFLAADGTYVLAWRNNTGMYMSDRNFQAAIDFGDAQQALVWGDAMLQMIDDADGRLYGAQVRDGGAIALIPEAEAEDILIHRVQLLEDLSRRQSLDWLPEGVTLQAGHGVLLPEGLALGMVEANGENAVLIHEKGHSRLQSSEVWDMDDLWLLPDGTGYLSCGDFADSLVRYDSKGAATVLLEQYQDVLSEENGIQYVDCHWNMTLRYGIQGDVLAAANDKDTLLLWRNGELLREVTLPEELTVGLYDRVKYYRMLALGEEYVYLSHYKDAEDVSMDGIAVYNMAQDTWQTIPCDHLALTKARLITNSTGAYFALLDDSDVLHMYDAAGNVLYSKPFPVPGSVVRQLEFAVDDRYLLAKTSDRQALILDAATGETLFRQRLGTYEMGNIRCYWDETNNRLYLTDTYSCKDEGLCLDMGSWTVLARIPGFLCYDAREDAIYCVNEEGSLIRCRLPAVQELTDYWYRALEPKA